MLGSVNEVLNLSAISPDTVSTLLRPLKGVARRALTAMAASELYPLISMEAGGVFLTADDSADAAI